jgi:hypothetical protein
MTGSLLEPVCHACGIPADAGFFDSSSIADAPTEPGQEIVLARYELHRNYCGVLHYFAQFTDAYAADPTQVATPELRWQIRCNGQPRDPYLTFDRIINPWGLSGFPIHLRLEEGSLVEFVVQFAAPSTPIVILSSTAPPILKVGGRLLGRYWYNREYGGFSGSA